MLPKKRSLIIRGDDAKPKVPVIDADTDTYLHLCHKDGVNAPNLPPPVKESGAQQHLDHMKKMQRERLDAINKVMANCDKEVMGLAQEQVTAEWSNMVGTKNFNKIIDAGFFKEALLQRYQKLLAEKNSPVVAGPAPKLKKLGIEYPAFKLGNLISSEELSKTPGLGEALHAPLHFPPKESWSPWTGPTPLPKPTEVSLPPTDINKPLGYMPDLEKALSSAGSHLYGAKQKPDPLANSPFYAPSSGAPIKIEKTLHVSQLPKIIEQWKICSDFGVDDSTAFFLADGKIVVSPSVAKILRARLHAKNDDAPGYFTL